ncbi:MAG: hypothetical protein IKE91_06170 [Clostridia bacterium]|nr:hypothetical protein [bacterium]MBR2705034.1 hypothetical protein [Clostridia bacterium]
MKQEFEDLLEEIKERMEHYLSKADEPSGSSCFIGHYIEAKYIKERIEEILYGKDKNLY